jgi:triosephosphate isomerase
MRKMLIAGNWKMNMNLHESQTLITEINNKIEGLPTALLDILVCPSQVNLFPVAIIASVNQSEIHIGAQNVHYEAPGAYTGEASAEQLASLSMQYCIIGHSERRTLFGETDDTVNKKAKVLLENDIVPIICIGETLEEREAGKTMEVLKRQIKAAYEGIADNEVPKTVIAYEPVWAIGTGVSATPEDAGETHDAIRAYLGELKGAGFASMVPILYGGSMNQGNAADLLKQENIDGGLIGGASLKADSFVEIIKEAINLVPH